METGGEQRTEWEKARMRGNEQSNTPDASEGEAWIMENVDIRGPDCFMLLRPDIAGHRDDTALLVCTMLSLAV